MSRVEGLAGLLELANLSARYAQAEAFCISCGAIDVREVVEDDELLQSFVSSLQLKRLEQKRFDAAAAEVAGNPSLVLTSEPPTTLSGASVVAPRAAASVVVGTEASAPYAQGFAEKQGESPGTARFARAGWGSRQERARGRGAAGAKGGGRGGRVGMNSYFAAADEEEDARPGGATSSAGMNPYLSRADEEDESAASQNHYFAKPSEESDMRFGRSATTGSSYFSSAAREEEADGAVFSVAGTSARSRGRGRGAVARGSTNSFAAAAEEEDSALRAELAPLTLAALKRRARAEGVDEGRLEAVDDAADAKAAAIELVCSTIREKGKVGKKQPSVSRTVSAPTAAPSTSAPSKLAKSSTAGSAYFAAVSDDDDEDGAPSHVVGQREPGAPPPRRSGRGGVGAAGGRGGYGRSAGGGDAGRGHASHGGAAHSGCRDSDASCSARHGGGAAYVRKSRPAEPVECEAKSVLDTLAEKRRQDEEALAAKREAARQRRRQQDSGGREEGEQEKRVDPDDERTYTLYELKQRYRELYSEDEVQQYWREECRPVLASQLSNSTTADTSEACYRHAEAGDGGFRGGGHDRHGAGGNAGGGGRAAGGSYYSASSGRHEPQQARGAATGARGVGNNNGNARQRLRVDPEDGQAYSYEDLQRKYKGSFSEPEISAYWQEECRPVGRS